MILDPIQWLRALAAAMVVVHHARHEIAALGLRGLENAVLPWWAGVDVFFVISGFIIVHATGAVGAAPGGRGRFLAHRIARVVPLYWLVTTLFLAIALVRPSLLGDGSAAALDPAYVAASYLFWPLARADGTPQPLYGLGWTLNCEMFFYAAFALGLGWGRRVAVAWIAAFLVLLTILGAALFWTALPLAFWSNPVVLEFLLGAGIALARAEGLRLGGPVRGGLTALGLGLLGLAEALGAEPLGFARPLVFGLPAALLVAAAGLGGAGRGVETPGSPPLRWLGALGNASYALYLVHPFVLRAGREAIGRLGLAGTLGPWLCLGVLVLSSGLVALLVHRFVERPLSRRLRRILDPGPDSGPAAAKSM